MNAADPTPVSLEPVQPEQRLLLANLMQFYLHDMSELFPIELGLDGTYRSASLPLYGADPRHFAFIVRASGRVAGFALLTRGSPASADPAALDMTEFFVLRQHRRSSIGRRA